MEPEGSLLRSQKPPICPYPEPDPIIYAPPSHFLKQKNNKCHTTFEKFFIIEECYSSGIPAARGATLITWLRLLLLKSRWGYFFLRHSVPRSLWLRFCLFVWAECHGTHHCIMSDLWMECRKWFKNFVRIYKFMFWYVHHHLQVYGYILLQLLRLPFFATSVVHWFLEVQNSC
jgi:hypothetical protein